MTRTILRVVTLFSEMVQRRFRKQEFDVFVFQAFCDELHLHANNFPDRFRREDVEEHYFVESVQELRTEIFLERAHYSFLHVLVTLDLGPRNATAKTKTRHFVYVFCANV